MLTTELMRAPDMRDGNDLPCLIVIKNGGGTGVTIGHATGIFSYVRDVDTNTRSTEWAIYNYDSKSGVFSSGGDSGSAIVDGLGRIGGLLTGGAGLTDGLDVTYATPMCWLLSRIHQRFPHAHLNPGAIPE
jgi:hypothetical protein